MRISTMAPPSYVRLIGAPKMFSLTIPSSSIRDMFNQQSLVSGIRASKNRSIG